MGDLDIWEVLSDVLDQHEAICVIAFFTHYYYNHPTHTVAEMLQVKTEDVEYWLAKIRTDLYRSWRARGGQIGPGGAGVADPYIESYFEGEELRWSKYGNDDEEEDY